MQTEWIVLNLVWAGAGGLFGYYMFRQGAVVGAVAGIKAACIYMEMNGDSNKIKGLLRFVDKIGARVINEHDEEDEEG